MSTDHIEIPSAATPPREKTRVEAKPVIDHLRGQLVGAKLTLTKLLAAVSATDAPTTYNTYRWLGTALQSSYDALSKMLVAAGLSLEDECEPYFVTVEYFEIPKVLETAENEVITAMKPFKLDELPPGNPGEPEFERLLKILIALNRAYEFALKNLAELNNALHSDTYKLGITEEDRKTAWRKQRRAELERVLKETEKQLKESQDYTAALKNVKADLEQKLSDNDQMTFSEVDPAKTPEIGESVMTTEPGSAVPPQ